MRRLLLDVGPTTIDRTFVALMRNSIKTHRGFSLGLTLTFLGLSIFSATVHPDCTAYL